MNILLLPRLPYKSSRRDDTGTNPSFLKERIITIGGETKLQGKIILIEHSDCFCAFDIANIIATLGRALKAQGVAVD